MKIAENPDVHLTYSQNVHPGRSWVQALHAMRTVTLPVRDVVAPGRAFGLGLRLGAQAAAELAQPKALAQFKEFLRVENLYVFTINGFPYGEFHAGRVKEEVYRPDWQTTHRLMYTNLLADILAELLPEGVDGSISTVPGSYKPWVTTGEARTAMVDNMAQCVAHLVDIRERTGCEIHLGLEPEPDCFIETTGEAIEFLTGEMADRGSRRLAQLTGMTQVRCGRELRRHLGVCFDTCHLSLQFEDLRDSLFRLATSGVRISKVQVSSALKTMDDSAVGQRLRPFCDGVYLHQVKARAQGAAVRSLGDLDDVLAADAPVRAGGGAVPQQWRVHCHVPLYFAGQGELASTADELTPELFAVAVECGARHLEMETYTFDVLPKAVTAAGSSSALRGDLADSIAREYAWVLARTGCLLH